MYLYYPKPTLEMCLLSLYFLSLLFVCRSFYYFVFFFFPPSNPKLSYPPSQDIFDSQSLDSKVLEAIAALVVEYIQQQFGEGLITMARAAWPGRHGLGIAKKRWGRSAVAHSTHCQKSDRPKFSAAIFRLCSNDNAFLTQVADDNNAILWQILGGIRRKLCLSVCSNSTIYIKYSEYSFFLKLKLNK